MRSPFDERGQMTVEMAVALPVLIVVAVMVTNALQFFSLCASFDRVAHNQVRIVAASPAYGQDAGRSCALVENALRTTFGESENVEVSVSHGSAGLDLDAFTAALEYHPTLFGMGLRNEVLGVPLPSLVHSTRFVVDCYKPGVVL